MIAAVFARFAACGSVRGTWLWLREQHLKWPLQPAACTTSQAPEVIWVEPTYHAVHTTLTHPAATNPRTPSWPSSTDCDYAEHPTPTTLATTSPPEPVGITVGSA